MPPGLRHKKTRCSHTGFFVCFTLRRQACAQRQGCGPWQRPPPRLFLLLGAGRCCRCRSGRSRSSRGRSAGGRLRSMHGIGAMFFTAHVGLVARHDDHVHRQRCKQNEANNNLPHKNLLGSLGMGLFNQRAWLTRRVIGCTGARHKPLDGTQGPPLAGWALHTGGCRSATPQGHRSAITDQSLA